MVAGFALLFGLAQSHAQTPAAPAPGVDAALIEDIVVGSRILADFGVLDGFGHVSARDPNHPNRFWMSRSLAPAQVTADDIMGFDLDGNPVDAQGRSVFLERFIHSEIYQARPDVMSVVHTHSPGVIPFTVSQVPLRAIYHNPAFLAAGAPVWDIRKDFGDTDMLVRNPVIGKSLAQTLGDKSVVDGESGGVPRLLYRRQCQAAVTGNRARRRGQLSHQGRRRQGRRRQSDRARPYLGPVEAARRAHIGEVDQATDHLPLTFAAYLAATLLACWARSRSITVRQPVLRLARCFSMHAVMRETSGISELQRRKASPVHICCASALKAKLRVDSAQIESAKASVRPAWRIVLLLSVVIVGSLEWLAAAVAGRCQDLV
jgi:Class II Aldolase and Adducin N-terminal domain